MTDREAPTTVMAYLRELDLASRGLPQSVRVGLRARAVRDLAAKAGSEPGEAEIAAALTEMGKPTTLVAAERERYQLDPDPLLPRDVAAVYLLASGPFLLGFGVIGGLVLLWTSPRWPARQRTTATLLILVGAVLSLLLPLAASGMNQLVAALLGLLVAGPWGAAAYLAAIRSHRRIRAARQAEARGVE